MYPFRYPCIYFGILQEIFLWDIFFMHNFAPQSVINGWLWCFSFCSHLYILARWDEGKEERARRTLQNNIIFEIMNEIQIFNNNNFGKLRVIVKDGKVWFCLADACKALEIKNPRDVKNRLDSRGVDTIDTPTSSNNQHGEFTRTQTFTFINEANLYLCIFQSS